MAPENIGATELVITTVTVEVKILTIGGKQVTLEMFRQLPQEHVIDPETLEFRGPLWGRVHYFWGECAEKEEAGHFHIVWQKGSELRRACVEENPFWDSEVTLHISNLEDDLDRINRIGMLQTGCIQMPSRSREEGEDWAKVGNWKLPYDDGDIRLLKNIWMQGEGYTFIREEAKESIQQRIQTLFDRLNQEVRRMLTFPPDDQQRIEAKSMIENRVIDIRSKWAKRYNQICALDQLFING